MNETSFIHYFPKGNDILMVLYMQSIYNVHDIIRNDTLHPFALIENALKMYHLVTMYILIILQCTNGNNWVKRLVYNMTTRSNVAYYQTKSPNNWSIPFKSVNNVVHIYPKFLLEQLENLFHFEGV